MNSAIEKAKEAITDCDGPLEELQGLQEEYQEWYDNLPESGMDTVRDKLEEIANFDFDVSGDLDSIESVKDDAEGADLPLGFGRD